MNATEEATAKWYRHSVAEVTLSLRATHTRPTSGPTIIGEPINGLRKRNSCLHRVASKRLYLAHTPKVQPPSEYAMGHPNRKLIRNLSTSIIEALSACCRSLLRGLGSKVPCQWCSEIELYLPLWFTIRLFVSFTRYWMGGKYLGASSYYGSGCAISFEIAITNTRRPVDTPPITSSSSLVPAACTYMSESTRIQLQLRILFRLLAGPGAVKTSHLVVRESRGTRSSFARGYQSQEYNSEDATSTRPLPSETRCPRTRNTPISHVILHSPMQFCVGGTLGTRSSAGKEALIAVSD
ncbi:hypothetical protein WG66_003135 [Moniliophthora roreri]|nr:hypothetical protein WG66_003135 [Moniliophthora roreri]